MARNKRTQLQFMGKSFYATTIAEQQIMEQLTMDKVMIFNKPQGDIMMKLASVIKMRNDKPEKQITDLRPLIELGAELFFRVKIPRPALHRGAGIDKSYPAEIRRKYKTEYYQAIVSDTLPEQAKEAIIENEMDGNTLTLFLWLVTFALQRGKEVVDNQIQIDTTFSELRSLIFPNSKNKDYTKKRILVLLANLAKAPAVIIEGKKTESLITIARKIKVIGKEGKKTELEIRIDKTVINRTYNNYYRVSLVFMSIIAGPLLAIESYPIPAENPPTGQTLSIIRKLYIRIISIGNKTLSGTLEQIAAQTGETTGGISRRLIENTKKALLFLSDRNIISIQGNIRKKYRFLTIRNNPAREMVEQIMREQNININTNALALESI